MTAGPTSPPLSAPTFVAPPAGPLAVGDGVDVWAVALDADAAAVARSHAVLDEGERARAARLADPRLGARFAMRRAALRAILARYVAAAPAALRFRRVGEARPRLVDPAVDLVYSAADAEDLALIAVARHDPLGVDVEHVRDVVEREEIAARYLAPDDAAAVHAAATEDARRLAFFRGWTRLEALAKALDGGVYRHVARRDAAGSGEAEGGLVPFLFTPRAGFVAALAAGASGPRRFFALAR